MNDFADILDLLVRHTIYLQRLSAQQAHEIGRILNGSASAMAGEIRDRLEEIIAIGNFTRKQEKELLGLQKAIETMTRKNYEKAEKAYMKELRELLDHEIDQIATITRSALTPASAAGLVMPSAASLDRVLAYSPFSGYTIREWFTGLERKQVAAVMSRVRLGIANGETIDDMVRAIRGTRKTGYTDGILVGSTTSQAQMLARTITNGVTNQAHQEFYKANRKLIAYEVFTATLDGRTSSICQSLDGEQYEVGAGPVPPMHPNCRSRRVPVTRDMEESGLLGSRPYVRDAQVRNEREKRFRAEAKEAAGSKWSGMTEKQRQAAIRKLRTAWQEANIGQVSAKTNYQTWLKRQPAWFQKQVLGPSRYQLFSKGGLTLDRFVDSNYKPYTLEQLKALDREAFKKAGLI